MAADPIPRFRSTLPIISELLLTLLSLLLPALPILLLRLLLLLLLRMDPPIWLARKNLRLGTELSFAGVKFTPPKAFREGVVVDEDAGLGDGFGEGGASSFLVEELGFFYSLI